MKTTTDPLAAILQQLDALLHGHPEPLVAQHLQRAKDHLNEAYIGLSGQNARTVDQVARQAGFLTSGVMESLTARARAWDDYRHPLSTTQAALDHP